MRRSRYRTSAQTSGEEAGTCPVCLCRQRTGPGKGDPRRCEWRAGMRRLEDAHKGQGMILIAAISLGGPGDAETGDRLMASRGQGGQVALCRVGGFYFSRWRHAFLTGYPPTSLFLAVDEDSSRLSRGAGMRP
jgi:hypothetical protein